MSFDVSIGLAPGCKCQRCRKFAIEVGLIVQWPDLCRDCAIFMEVVRPQPAYDRLQRQLLDHPIRRLAHDPSVPGVVYPNGPLRSGRGARKKHRGSPADKPNEKKDVQCLTRRFRTLGPARKRPAA